MSRLKISNNLFLEVAELNKALTFLTDDGYKRILKSVINKFGIVKNANNTYFKVTKQDNGIIKINSGLAFNTNLDAIVLKDDITLNIANVNTKRWIILSRDINNFEEGTVSITTDGTLTGIGTKFTEILRGQPNFPNKIKFESNLNNDEYEVVSVNSDTSAVLTGNFVEESNIKYSIIGTFTPGFQVSDENKEIYEYDGYSIEIIDSDEKPFVSDDKFILAYIYFEDDIMYVVDERIYCMFNQEYISSNDKNFLNPLVSLLKVSVVSGINAINSKSCDLELILEHGYSVSSYKINSSSTSTIFQIIVGNCNYYGTSSIPDNLFNDWILLNRINMKYSVINNNIGKNLYISDFDSEMIENENDFVIIPNFKEIEYEVKCLSNNVENKDIPFYFKNSIENINTRMRIYAIFPAYNGDSTVSFAIRYRFIDKNDNKYPFANLATATFTNINEEKEILSESKFSIDIYKIEPEEEIKNYS